MYWKLSWKGDAVSWSFLVKGPARMSNRWEPEFAMTMNGFDRVLLMRIAVGTA